MKRILQGLVVAAIFLALASSNAFAWGNKGHRLTALVAYQLLTDSAKQQLKAILGTTGDLATAALYLDINKDSLDDKIPGSRDWHYDDRPVCFAQAPRAEYCPGGNCASIQLRRHYDILTDAESSKAKKLFAIRVISHLTGDIHQPLHASDHDDRGGNGVKLTPASRWLDGEKANLHSAWDKDFVIAAFSKGDYANKAEAAVVKQLVAEITDEQKKQWAKGRVTSWLAESYSIASSFTYKDLPTGLSCPVEGQTADDPVGGKITLLEEYISKAEGMVPEQIKKGAVRLAAILNRALATEAASSGYVRAQSL